jgi:hypothetical protein
MNDETRNSCPSPTWGGYVRRAGVGPFYRSTPIRRFAPPSPTFAWEEEF